MFRIASVVLFSFAIVGCAKSKPSDSSGSAGSSTTGSAMTGSASAEGSGSAAVAGSGSAEGSGSAAVAGSGSAEGSGSAAAAGSGAEGSAAGSAVAASDFDFDKLSQEDKIKFMKQKVMPAMKPAFQKFDPKEFATFNCKTCHGKDPQKTKYKMPNPELPALDFEALKAGKGDPKMVEFMAKVVKPEMAKLLNVPEMTETVHEGFGCLDCHTMKKKK